MLRRAVILLALLPACAPAPTSLSVENMPVVNVRRAVKVGIPASAPSVTISCDGAMIGTDTDGGHRMAWPEGGKVFTATRRGVLPEGEHPYRELRVRSRDASRFLSCGGLLLRGDLILRQYRGRVTVIEEVTVDDYLKAVLPLEANPAWPPEALKAQAVATRTYLASHLWRHGREGFDVCVSTHCLLYEGAAREDPRASAAVKETAGQLLIYNGRPVSDNGVAGRKFNAWGARGQALQGRRYLDILEFYFPGARMATWNKE